MPVYTLFFDGLFRESSRREDGAIVSGLMCYGWVIYKNHNIIAEGHGGTIHEKIASSNGAEYIALLEGMEALIDIGICREKIKIIGDSRSVIEQMQGIADVNSHRIISLYNRVKKLSDGFANIKWIWIPRNRNREADSLTRHALNQILFINDFNKKQVSKHPTRGGKNAQRKGFFPVYGLSCYTNQIKV